MKENRSDPNSRDIRLHVTIFETSSRNPEPDPVVYLSGGPGQGAVRSISSDFALGGYAAFREDRDFIVIDQRGTGYSEPNLACPGLEEDFQAQTDGFTESLLSETTLCRDRLIANGVDLYAYNSAESAADVEELRRALRYEEWNLLGVSYGTRLALTIVRDFPEGVRSVVLDSAYPLEVDLYETQIANIDRALSSLEQECLNAGVCDESFKSTLLNLAASLDEDPVTLEITDAGTQEQSPITFDGAQLISLMVSGMYSSQMIPHLPALVESISKGEYGFAAVLLSTFSGGDFVATGAHYSIQCAEEVPFTDSTAIDDDKDSFPELNNLFASTLHPIDQIKSVCGIWGEGDPLDIENRSVEVDGIPALILSGELDPVTPPEWGLAVDEAFSNSSYLRFKGVGHAVSFNSECGLEAALNFVDSPFLAIETGTSLPCFTDLAEVQFIGLLESITIVEFEGDRQLPFISVRPDGWSNELLDVMYQRSDLGLFVILQQTFEIDRYKYIETYFDSIGVEAPNISEVVETPFATWSVMEFEFSGLVFFLAVGDFGSEISGTVLASSLPETRDLIYEELLLPAIQAFHLPDET